MYGATRPRPKKTNIVRSRGGCGPCRNMRRKCDESKPDCMRCERSGKACWYGSPDLRWLDATSWAAVKSKRARGEDVKVHPVQIAEPTCSPDPPQTDSQTTRGRDGSLPQGSESSALGISSTDGTNNCHQLAVSEKSFLELVASENFTADSTSGSLEDSTLYTPGTYGLIWGDEGSASLKYRRTMDLNEDPSNASRSDLLDDSVLLTHYASHELPELSRLVSVLKPPSSCQHAAGPQQWLATKTSPITEHDYFPLSLGLQDTSLSATSRKYLTHFATHVTGLLPRSMEPVRGVTAFRYVGNALSLAAKRHSPDVAVLVLAQILLSFVELELGTFDGLRRYLHSIDDLVYENQHDLLTCPNGSSLLGVVSDCRSFHRFMCGPWTTQPPLSKVDRFWARLESRSVSEEALLQKIGSDALLMLNRLSLFESLRHSLVRPHHIRDRLIDIISPWLIPEHKSNAWSESEIVHGHHMACVGMELLSKQAGRCRTPREILCSGGCEYFDISSQADDPADTPDRLNSKTGPLRFESHESAMRVADYAFSQMICDEEIVRKIVSPRGSPTCFKARRWLEVLMRISKGLDMSAVLTGNAKALDLIQKYYKDANISDRAWEDPTFPTRQTAPVIELVKDQLKQNRKILLASWLEQACDTKATIKSTQPMPISLVLYGMEASGQPFGECVLLDNLPP
ncbi:hypothetical protein ACCO45_002570 [Purpureocillium lilacinum]|uniref:Uncharacterized protein n=1 Tax=Purpureocillium lilacinum TaxID=33203 RepID=A0ACC4EA91_PURLI